MDEQMIELIARAMHEADWRQRLAERSFDDNPEQKWWLEMATAAHSVIAGKVAELKDWAFEQSRLHHRLAAENEPLRTEHIASSTAYRELGLKLREQAALAPYPERRSE